MIPEKIKRDPADPVVIFAGIGILFVLALILNWILRNADD